jgi:hypothetical protein
MELYFVEGCCGVRELAGIGEGNSSEFILRSFCNEVYTNALFNEHQDITEGNEDRGNFAHVFFTQAGVGKTYGENLASYIQRHGLGNVVATPSMLNPNSGNNLKMWVWTVNWKTTAEWAKERGEYNNREYNDVDD